MLVVSNTSPVLNLAIVNQLFLLQEQFGQVLIPAASLEELRIHEELPGSEVIRKTLEVGWLRVEEVEDRTLVHVLREDLDRGEAEAIALAIQVKAARILLDEREGRRVAKSLGLKITGVLGVLLRARLDGRISSLRQAMVELQGKAGFRIGADLFADLLRASGEDD